MSIRIYFSQTLQEYVITRDGEEIATAHDYLEALLWSDEHDYPVESIED